MKIFVIDDQKPEVEAMLAALYSRDPQSVEVHLEQVKTKGPEKFMAQYYVGYGHKSIGDCGTTSIFIENISMLAAKAIQDTPLYNGQEASTRYLDMVKQEVLNPLGTDAGQSVQTRWMELYSQVLACLIPILKARFPHVDGSVLIYEKAIKAKAFDIARSLLPAGCTTYVAWHTNLRQAHDHLCELEGHPLKEVRAVGDNVRLALKRQHPSSFGHKINEDQETYIRQSMAHFAYHYEDIKEYSFNSDCCKSSFNEDEIRLLATRPSRCELHQRFRGAGVLDFNFLLDFGSYRDLQRQRSSIQEMPLLTMSLGFHEWYLDQLPGWVHSEISEISKQAMALFCNDVVKQYYIPMGFKVCVKMTCPLPAAVYIAELRSAQTVHPTLRQIAQQMGRSLQDFLPNMKLHVDYSDDQWSTKRGTQDIVKA